MPCNGSLQPRTNSSPILGWQTVNRPAFGFAPSQSPSSEASLQALDVDGHLMTVAPTGAGKGRGVLIPNLLTYAGPVFVIDPKGELYNVTAERRRQLGQHVVRLDPFRITGSDTDALNPFDVLSLPGADLELDSYWLASSLTVNGAISKDPFWNETATAFIGGLITYLATQSHERRTLNELRRMLHADDTIYNLAVVLDTQGKDMNPLAKQEIAAVLQMPDVTRGGALATAISFLKPFASQQAAEAFQPSTVPLEDVISGRPLSIYITIPPDKLRSHRALIKLWVGTLLKAIMARTQRPALPTLFLIDETARLEHFPLLETAITLCRGYGLHVWTFWQDLQQIQDSFPTGWRTLINNSAVLQTFGIATQAMAYQWGEFLSHSPSELMSLARDEQILSVHGRGEQRGQRFDYLQDELFQGLYRANPLFADHEVSPSKATISQEQPHVR